MNDDQVQEILRQVLQDDQAVGGVMILRMYENHYIRNSRVRTVGSFEAKTIMDVSDCVALLVEGKAKIVLDAPADGAQTKEPH